MVGGEKSCSCSCDACRLPWYLLRSAERRLRTSRVRQASTQASTLLVERADPRESELASAGGRVEHTFSPPVPPTTTESRRIDHMRSAARPPRCV